MYLASSPLLPLKVILVVGLSYFSAFASNETSDNSHWLENILPANYSKRHSPSHDLSTGDTIHQTIIRFRVVPRHVMSIEPKTMDFAVDMIIYIGWVEHRLIIPEELRKEKYLTVEIPREVAMNLWIPPIYLENCKACDDWLTDPSTQRFKLGTRRNYVSIKISKIFKFTCAIDLRNYPFDAQRCKIRIEKYGIISHVPFGKFYDLHTDKIQVPPQFALIGIKRENCSETNHYWIECIDFVFHLKRMIANHVMLVFIPSMLIVILSWISFWLDVEVAAPRVALGLTSLLTLATQLNNSQRDLPPVSAVKAVDIWMFSCMFMVFGSLIEFAVANSWARRKKNTAKVDPEAAVNGFMTRPLINLGRRTFTEHTVTRKDKSPLAKGIRHSSPIDFFARIAFPVAFIVFNIVFWGYFATKEE